MCVCLGSGTAHHQSRTLPLECLLVWCLSRPIQDLQSLTLVPLAGSQRGASRRPVTPAARTGAAGVAFICQGAARAKHSSSDCPC